MKRLVYNKGTLYGFYTEFYGDPYVHPFPVTFTIYDNVEMIYCKYPSPSLTVYNHFYRKLNLYIKFPSCTYPGFYSAPNDDGGVRRTGCGEKTKLYCCSNVLNVFSVKQPDTGPLVLFQSLGSRVCVCVHLCTGSNKSVRHTRRRRFYFLLFFLFRTFSL